MRYELTIPPNTPIQSPVVVRAQFTGSPSGRISHSIVRIPSGHAYLTGFQMVAGRTGRAIPASSSNVEWIRGDGGDGSGLVDINEAIQLDPPQYAIELRGYNLDDTYTHTFYLDLE